MKRYLLRMSLVVILLGRSHALTHEEMIESRRNEETQVSLWEGKLAECRDKPDAVKLSELWLGLRNMGYRNTRPNHSADVPELYARLQQVILSIPGHAEFYAAPVWESYAAYRDPAHPRHPGSADWFSQESQYAFGTLMHLPGPETVRELGEMLKEEWQQVLTPDSTVQNVPGALGKNAMRTLIELPLRDMPTPRYDRDVVKGQLAAWQRWYAEVKSGKRGFSFKGQDVEYRFKPDGTWETSPIANPPDDGPKIPETIVPEPLPDTQPAPNQNPESPANGSMLYLFAAISAFLATLAVYFGRPHFRTKH